MPFDVGYVLEVWKDGKLQSSFPLPRVGTVARKLPRAKSLTWTLGDRPVIEYSGVRAEQWEVTGRSGLRYRREEVIKQGKTGAGAQRDPQYADGPTLFRSFEQWLDQYEEDARDYQHQQARLRANPLFYAASRGIPSVGDVVTAVALTNPTSAVTSESEILPDPELGSVGLGIFDGGTGRVAEPGIRMVLRATWEEHDRLVEPMIFNWQRSTGSSRHSYEWSLSLTAYGKVANKPRSLLGGFRDLMKAGARLVDGLTNTTIGIQNKIREVTATLETAKEPLRAVIRFARAWQGVINAAGAFTRIPQGFADTAFQLLNEVGNTVYSVLDALAPVPAPRGMIELLTDLNELRRKAVLYMGLQSVRTGGPGTINMPATADAEIPIVYEDVGTRMASFGLGRAPVQPHTVQAGETLQDLAETYLGDPALWPAVAEANQLHDPFLLWDGVPIQPGAVLQVPVPMEPDAGLLLDNAEQTFGVDLKLGADGDLVISSSNDDLRTIRGAENLRQAYTLRLTTFQGQNGVFPAVGLPAAIGEPNVATTVGRTAGALRQQLLSDRRTRRVERLEAVDGGDRLIYEAEVSTLLGSRVNIAVPFPQQSQV